jgi:hypothetical protein
VSVAQQENMMAVTLSIENDFVFIGGLSADDENALFDKVENAFYFNLVLPLEGNPYGISVDEVDPHEVLEVIKTELEMKNYSVVVQ